MSVAIGYFIIFFTKDKNQILFCLLLVTDLSHVNSIIAIVLLQALQKGHDRGLPL